MKTLTGTVERKQFFVLHQAGKSYAEIGALFGVSPTTVRSWCRRQRDGGGVENRYTNPRAGTLSRFDRQLPEALLALRRAHPRWGPESLLLHLRQDPFWREQSLPSRATVARFLHGFAEFRHAPKKRGR